MVERRVETEPASKREGPQQHERRRHVVPPADPHPILSGIEQEVRLPPGVTGMGAFVSVVCNLSRRISLGEARHFFASLLPDLRRLVEPCLEGRGEQPERWNKAEYLKLVATDLRLTDLAQAESIARAVFRHVEEYLPTSVFEHVMSQLPRELSDMWALPERP
ncbi:MAG: hypothetical protein JWP87_3863 [Labilithrix sp.]|nr:hypothetical protein [Labilithrix sp.]